MLMVRPVLLVFVVHLYQPLKAVRPMEWNKN